MQLLHHLLSTAAQGRLQPGIIHTPDGLDGITIPLAPAVVQDLGALEIIQTGQGAAHAQRPVHRCTGKAEGLLDLVQQGQRVATVAIQLVDEGHDGRAVHAADLHQSAGALLDTLGGIDDHQRSIHGRERPVGILGKILVARRVHQVDDAAAIGKLHHRCRHRDATLPFDGHPV